MKTSIILDVDGTLWDSTKRIAESYNQTIQRLGIPDTHVSVEEIHGVMGMVTEDIAATIFPQYPFEKQMELITTCMNEECEYLKDHPGDLYPEVESVLAKLSEEHDLYIVSNCQDGYIETLFSVYDIQKYITDYECSGRTGKKKGINIRMLMERNQVENAVYVGDTQKDKEASIDAHIPFIFASYGFGNVDEYERKIDSFQELLNLV
ncbi:MAG: HAD family hydrolase [Longicatena sp.]